MSRSYLPYLILILAVLVYSVSGEPEHDRLFYSYVIKNGTVLTKANVSRIITDDMIWEAYTTYFKGIFNAISDVQLLTQCKHCDIRSMIQNLDISDYWLKGLIIFNVVLITCQLLRRLFQKLPFGIFYRLRNNLFSGHNQANLYHYYGEESSYQLLMILFRKLRRDFFSCLRRTSSRNSWDNGIFFEETSYQVLKRLLKKLRSDIFSILRKVFPWNKNCEYYNDEESRYQVSRRRLEKLRFDILSHLRKIFSRNRNGRNSNGGYHEASSHVFNNQMSSRDINNNVSSYFINMEGSGYVTNNEENSYSINNEARENFNYSSFHYYINYSNNGEESNDSEGNKDRKYFNYSNNGTYQGIDNDDYDYNYSRYKYIDRYGKYCGFAYFSNFYPYYNYHGNNYIYDNDNHYDNEDPSSQPQNDPQQYIYPENEDDQYYTSFISDSTAPTSVSTAQSLDSRLGAPTSSIGPTAFQASSSTKTQSLPSTSGTYEPKSSSRLINNETVFDAAPPGSSKENTDEAKAVEGHNDSPETIWDKIIERQYKLQQLSSNATTDETVLNETQQRFSEDEEVTEEKRDSAAYQQQLSSNSTTNHIVLNATPQQSSNENMDEEETEVMPVSERVDIRERILKK